MEFRQVTGSATDAEADVLAFSVSGDPTKDSLCRTIDQALGGALAQPAKAESFERKLLQTLMVPTGGRIRARRVLVIGTGPRGELKLPSLRDVGALAVTQSNRVSAANLVLVVPAVGSARERAAIQL